MVGYGDDARRAADPSTPLTDLAALAAARPDLRALIAANPSSYPALLDWLRAQGDPVVIAALDDRDRAKQTFSRFARPVTAPTAVQAPAGEDITGDADARLDEQGAARRPGLGIRHLYWVLPVTVIIIVGLVVATAGAASFASRQLQAEGGGAAYSSPENTSDDGIVVGAGADGVRGGDDAPTIVMYVDYLCPYCGQFDTTNGEQLREWVDDGSVTVELHPIAILTSRSNGTGYSERAANAVACAADSSAQSAFELSGALFAVQPEESSDGLSDHDLIEIARAVGVDDLHDVSACITAGDYRGWVQEATSRALTGPIPGSDLDAVRATPTVLVNGEQYAGTLTDAREFAAFVATVSGSDAPLASTTALR